MYRISKYIEIHRFEDECILKNTLLDGEIEISKDYLIELDSIITNGKDKIDTELAEFLVENKYLYLKEVAESKYLQLSELLNETLVITMMPTMACNFRCEYCYEKHSSEVMDEEHVYVILDFIEKELTQNKVKVLQVNWFGGEPTLCENIIEEFNRKLITICEKNNISFVSGMTTNGYLLTRKKFEKYLDLGIDNYQITIDGWKHDELRKHKSGIKTLSSILSNLKEISKIPKEKNFFIRLRYNITPETEDISWYDYVYKLFGTDQRFSIYIHSVQDWGGDSVKKMNLCSQEIMSEIEKKHLDYIKKVGLSCANIYENTNALFDKVCIASYPYSYVFMPNGSIVRCTVELENDVNIIGRVDKELGVEIYKDKKEMWIQKDIPKNCFDCEKLKVCMHMTCPKQYVIDKRDRNKCDFEE